MHIIMHAHAIALYHVAACMHTCILMSADYVNSILGSGLFTIGHKMLIGQIPPSLIVLPEKKSRLMTEQFIFILLCMVKIVFHMVEIWSCLGQN